MGVVHLTRYFINACPLIPDFLEGFVLSKAPNLEILSRGKECITFSPEGNSFSDGVYGIQAGNVIDAALSLGPRNG